MRELLAAAVLAVLVPPFPASFCGSSGVPYSFEVLPSGAPVLGCAQPSCVIVDKNGKEDSEFLADIQGQVDGFFREGDRDTNRYRHESAPKFVANCSGEFNELSCSKKNQWVGGIEYIDHPRQPLILQCCTFEGLKFSQDVGMTTVGPGEAITGGEVIREGRQISFDVIANVRKVVEVGKPRKISYEVTVRRMNCLPDPPEPEVNFDADATEEIVKVLSSATGNDLGTISKFKHEKKPKNNHFKKRISEKLRGKSKEDGEPSISGATNDKKVRPTQHGTSQVQTETISSEKVISSIIDSDRRPSLPPSPADTDLTLSPTYPTLPPPPQQPQPYPSQVPQAPQPPVAPQASLAPIPTTPTPVFNPFFPFPPQPLAFGAPSASAVAPITPPTLPPMPTMATMPMPPEMRQAMQEAMTPKYYGLPEEAKGMMHMFPTVAPLPGFGMPPHPFPTLPPPPAIPGIPGFAPLPAPAAAQAVPTFGGLPGIPGLPPPAPIGVPPAPAAPVAPAAPHAPAVAQAAPTFGAFPGFPGFPAFPTLSPLPTASQPAPITFGALSPAPSAPQSFGAFQPAPAASQPAPAAPLPAPAVQAPAPSLPAPAIAQGAPIVQGTLVEDAKGRPEYERLPELVTHPPFASLDDMVKAIGTNHPAPQYNHPFGSPHFMPLGPPRVAPNAPLIQAPTLAPPPPAGPTAPPVPAAPQPLATPPPVAAQGSVLASFPGFQPIPVAGLGQLRQPTKKA